MSLSRRALAAAAAAVVAVVVAALPPVPATAGEPPALDVKLRVATYNIHAGIGSDGRFDLNRTTEAIRALNADVVGLQEVDVHWSSRSQWVDELSLLADALDMNAYFAPIYSLEPPAEGQPRREFGVAVLSEWPITAAENHLLTRLATTEPNPTPKPAPGFPEVVVNKLGAQVHVYVTHLDFRADPSVRRLQVADTLEILNEDAGRQRVLVGDFNAPPDAPELAPLWTTVIDAWAAAPGAGTGNTYSALNPIKRIDYVTSSPDVRVLASEVHATTASDHLPVVAELVVRRGR